MFLTEKQGKIAFLFLPSSPSSACFSLLLDTDLSKCTSLSSSTILGHPHPVFANHLLMPLKNLFIQWLWVWPLISPTYYHFNYNLVIQRYINDFSFLSDLLVPRLILLLPVGLSIARWVSLNLWTNPIVSVQSRHRISGRVRRTDWRKKHKTVK